MKDIRADGAVSNYADGMSPSAWAWEFLRRNRLYIADWLAFKALIGKFATRYPNFPGDEYAEFMVVPGHKVVTSESGILSGSFSRKTVHAMNFYGEKWGLQKIMNPESDFNPLTHRWIDSTGSTIFPREGFDFEDPRYMPVAVDLELPIEDQLKFIRIHYERERQRRSEVGTLSVMMKPRDRSTLYRNYLRVLDGFAAGETRNELAAELLPHVDDKYPERLASKRIDNWHMAAKKLRDGDYRLLPLIAR